MKIKKVDDKPMVIHTRQKAKLHTHEPKQASMIMYEASRPVTGTASRGAELFKNQVLKKQRQKIKKVDAGKKIAKKSVKNIFSGSSYLYFYVRKIRFMIFTFVKQIHFHFAFSTIAKFCCESPLSMVKQLAV